MSLDCICAPWGTLKRDPMEEKSERRHRGGLAENVAGVGTWMTPTGLCFPRSPRSRDSELGLEPQPSVLNSVKTEETVISQGSFLYEWWSSLQSRSLFDPQPIQPPDTLPSASFKKIQNTKYKPHYVLSMPSWEAAFKGHTDLKLAQPLR